MFGDRKPQSMDNSAWNALKKKVRDVGEKLFTEFLFEALTVEDQKKLEGLLKSEI